jgi:hypothetical protein
MTRGRTQHLSGAGMTPVEIAIGVSLIGSLLAIAGPTVLREIQASRFVEPTSGLAAIGAGAIAYSSGRPIGEAFPRPVGMTPAAPPRGRLEVDPPGTWADPTWRALGFPLAGSGLDFTGGVPHAFAFSFSSSLAAARSTFVAAAHADLDADGTLSTFEIRGHAAPPSAGGASLEPGMYVDSELE